MTSVGPRGLSDLDGVTFSPTSFSFSDQRQKGHLYFFNNSFIPYKAEYIALYSWFNLLQFGWLSPHNRFFWAFIRGFKYVIMVGYKVVKVP